MYDLLLLLFSLAGVSALAAIVDSFERPWAPGPVPRYLTVVKAACPGDRTGRADRRHAVRFAEKVRTS
jgi:hypothetical protein